MSAYMDTLAGEIGENTQGVGAGMDVTQNDPIDALRDHMKTKSLVDVHSHLLGMAPASFWVDRIMTTFLKKTAMHVETWPRDATHAYCLSTTQAPLGLPSVAPNYSSDVVYSLWSLAAAVSIEMPTDKAKVNTIKSKGDVDIKNKVFAKLGAPFTSPPGVADFETFFQPYSRWNARDQAIEHVYGIKNADLLKFMPCNPKLEAKIRQAFEMHFGDASDGFAKSSLFRGHFGTHFYPARYSLKDDIWFQRLDVLEELRKYVLERYFKNGVGYIELSVSASDVCIPWVWRHLVSDVFPSDSDIRVTVKYLAAFGRHKLDLAQFPSLGSQNLFSPSTCTQRTNPAFESHVQLLGSLKSTLDKCKSLPQGTKGPWTEIVGLDYVGDEYRRPYCPFNLPEFLTFLKEQRNDRQGEFGFRYHCGECDESSANQTPVWIKNHMAISSVVILDILSYLYIESGDQWPIPPIRLGHGLAFCHWLNDDHQQNITEPFESGESIIKSAMQAIISWEIPIEFNLTSNDYLVMQGQSPIFDFISRGCRIILCTDNDGIWNCADPTGEFGSVAAEYAMAITGEYTQNRAALDADGVANLIYAGRASCFTVSGDLDVSNLRKPVHPNRDILTEWQKTRKGQGNHNDQVGLADKQRRQPSTSPQTFASDVYVGMGLGVNEGENTNEFSSAFEAPALNPPPGTKTAVAFGTGVNKKSAKHINRFGSS